MQRLTWGDTALLDLLEPEVGLVEALRGSDASWPYALARAYEERGLPESARFVYREELDQGLAPWNGRSSLRLARLAGREGRWLVAEGYARRGVELLPDNRDIWYRFGEALYRQDRFEELLALTDQIPAFSGADSGEGEEISSLELGAERLLWRAVAAYHLDQEREKRFLEAFTRLPAQAIHSRLYLFLYYRNPSLSEFNPEVRRILEAVYRSSNGEHAEARRLFLLTDPGFVARTLLEQSEHDPEERMPALLRTLLQSAGNGDRRVEQWLTRLEDEEDLRDFVPELLAARSRYVEARGVRPEAMRLLAEAIDRERPEYIRDWVQAAIRGSVPLPLVLEELNRWEARGEDYSLAVDRLLPVMVREGRWEEIERVYAVLPDRAGEARAQLSVVTVLADRDGHRSLPEEEERQRRLEEALILPPTSYYGLLARRLAGEVVSLPRGEAGNVREDRIAELDHVGALVTAGLIERARRRAMIIALDGDAAEESLELARRFYALGHASAALDLARRAVTRGDLPVGEEEIPLLYPRPYAREISAAAEDHDVPEAILYGLIREESHFNPRAQSHVGATGLAQVMPATAEDLVRRMGLSTVELESVSDSVRMGAFYLRHLAGQLPDQLILQLAAYNAGPGRGRSWETQFGGLAPELQVEALPFIETRWYLRRIAVSSAWYQYRLSGDDPASLMPLFP